jgi:hypothetical protein
LLLLLFFPLPFLRRKRTMMGENDPNWIAAEEEEVVQRRVLPSLSQQKKSELKSLGVS